MYLQLRHLVRPTTAPVTTIHCSSLEFTRVWIGDALGNVIELAAKQAQEHWVKDDEATHCANDACGARFVRLLERRHHCRRCGRIFCGRCSNHTASVPKLGFYTPVRVCYECFETLSYTVTANPVKSLVGEGSDETAHSTQGTQTSRSR